MRLLLALCLAGLLGACAEPARVSGMTTTNVAGSSVSAHPGLVGSLTIGEVTGGEETDPLWQSEVSASAFKAAFEASLLTNALLNREGTAPYRVDAHLEELDQPLMGFDSDVLSTVRYKVFDSTSGELWLEREIQYEGTASVGDAFYGVDRLRIANERSIAGNIELFISTFIQQWVEQQRLTS